MTMMSIMRLEREQWQDYKLPFRYTSYNYYDVEISTLDAGFNVSFVKKPFDTPYVKKSDSYDKLFQPHWDDIKAWGIVKGGKLTAAIETAAEEWNNRLRVTELWVDDSLRRQGIGTTLMHVALRRAREEKRRAIVLETQSCNEGAIAFYLNYGFSLVGFDTCAYENNDLQRKEVRIEMGIFLDAL